MRKKNNIDGFSRLLFIMIAFLLVLASYTLFTTTNRVIFFLENKIKKYSGRDFSHYINNHTD